jgi:hypothetical protein
MNGRFVVLLVVGVVVGAVVEFVRRVVRALDAELATVLEELP